MVSRVPTFSLKRIRIQHHLVVPILLGIGIFAAFITTAPWPVLTAIGVAYLGSIPFTVASYRRLRRAYEARRAETLPEPVASEPDSAETAKKAS
jgi:CDP-diacylglycerol--serine O-phosphatidyltransferase